MVTTHIPIHMYTHAHKYTCKIPTKNSPKRKTKYERNPMMPLQKRCKTQNSARQDNWDKIHIKYTANKMA